MSEAPGSEEPAISALRRDVLFDGIRFPRTYGHYQWRTPANVDGMLNVGLTFSDIMKIIENSGLFVGVPYVDENGIVISKFNRSDIYRQREFKLLLTIHNYPPTFRPEINEIELYYHLMQKELRFLEHTKESPLTDLYQALQGDYYRLKGSQYEGIYSLRCFLKGGFGNYPATPTAYLDKLNSKNLYQEDYEIGDMVTLDFTGKDKFLAVPAIELVAQRVISLVSYLPGYIGKVDFIYPSP